MSYVDGCLLAVPAANKAVYHEHAERAAAVFKRHGALSLKEYWGDDLPEGKVNSMHTAVRREPDETVVMSVIAWPSKSARDEGWKAIMEDPEMTGQTMPFDGSRMIFGGFDVLLDA